MKISDDNAFVSEISKGQELFDHLTDGINFSDKGVIQVVIVNPLKTLPDYAGDINLRPIINSKVKKILESYELTENLQFLPVENTQEPRWLLNVLNNLSCLDKQKSIYTTYKNPDIIKKITHLVVNENLTNSRSIFKIAEYPYEIFINETLKQAFEAEGVTGIVISDNMDLSVGI